MRMFLGDATTDAAGSRERGPAATATPAPAAPSAAALAPRAALFRQVQPTEQP